MATFQKTPNKRALITGITGQDGSYLAEYLLSRDYSVYGMVRRTATDNCANISHITHEKFFKIYGDMADSYSLQRVIDRVQPHEVYNLAAQSFVGASWELPMVTQDITGTGALRLFEAVRIERPSARIYQAGSSEMFGKVAHSPQNEHTPFHPRSPYAVAKVTAHYGAINYRESYSMFVVNGILFNHESPRRGMDFVTQVVADGVAGIASKQISEFSIGNPAAIRDWGYAGDYVQAMHLMLQQTEPKDFVIGTGVTHSVLDLLETAFACIGIKQWGHLVRYDKARMRPAEVDTLCADASAAKAALGWDYTIAFEELVRMMVDARLRAHGMPLSADLTK
jgi:GDPmannose 4,6-dehydratase